MSRTRSPPVIVFASRCRSAIGRRSGRPPGGPKLRSPAPAVASPCRRRRTHAAPAIRCPRPRRHPDCAIAKYAPAPIGAGRSSNWALVPMSSKSPTTSAKARSRNRDDDRRGHDAAFPDSPAASGECGSRNRNALPFRAAGLARGNAGARRGPRRRRGPFLEGPIEARENGRVLFSRTWRERAGLARGKAADALQQCHAIGGHGIARQAT